MGYYSDIRVSLTKKDYLSIVKMDNKNSELCNYLLHPDKSYIKEYKENGIECILIQQYDIKYYKEFKEIQAFEKYLSNAKSGYVFFRIGGRWDDIEYRNTAKYKELENPFKFIKTIETKVKKEVLKELKSDIKNYTITAKTYTFTNEEDILEYYESDKKMTEYIKNKYNENIQFKLILYVDAKCKEAIENLYSRDAKSEHYVKIKEDNIIMDDALYYLGYPNEISFLEELNDEKAYNKENGKEEEEEYE